MITLRLFVIIWNKYEFWFILNVRWEDVLICKNKYVKKKKWNKLKISFLIEFIILFYSTIIDVM